MSNPLSSGVIVFDSGLNVEIKESTQPEGWLEIVLSGAPVGGQSVSLEASQAEIQKLVRAFGSTSQLKAALAQA